MCEFTATAVMLWYQRSVLGIVTCVLQASDFTAYHSLNVINVKQYQCLGE
jgi:hypothetical protein